MDKIAAVLFVVVVNLLVVPQVLGGQPKSPKGEELKRMRATIMCWASKDYQTDKTLPYICREIKKDMYMDTQYMGTLTNGLCSNTTNVTAVGSSNEKVEKKTIGHPYFGIMAGVGFAKIGKQQLDTTAGINNEYIEYLPTNRYRGAAVYGINGGYEFKLGSSNGLLSFGAGIYQSSNYSSKGQNWDIYEPDTSQNVHQLDYEYKLQSTRLMLETQLAWQLNLKKIKLIPFVSLGAGPALNLANSYQETPVASNVFPQLSFKAHSNINFAYQLGAGISCPFNADQSRLSIAYRYVDLGKRARFGSRSSDISYRLDVGRIRANEVYISYTHLFDL